MNFLKEAIKKYKDRKEERRKKIEIKRRNDYISQYHIALNRNELNSCSVCKHQIVKEYICDLDYNTVKKCELESPFYSSFGETDYRNNCRYFEVKDEIVLGEKYFKEDEQFLENKKLSDPKLEHHTY